MVQAQYPAGFLLCLLIGTTGAAWSAPVDAPSREAKEQAAMLAMERAQRQAANPLKAILEAAKIERRTVVAVTPLAPVAATLPRRTAVRSAFAPLPPSPARETLAAAFVLPTDATSAGEPSRPSAVAAVPALAPVPPAGATPPAVDMPQPVQPVSQPQARSEPGATAVPAPLPFSSAVDTKVSGSAASESPTESPQAMQAQTDKAAIAPPAIVQPKLVSMVQPSIPPRVWDELARGTEISVDLNIRSDGTVAAVEFIGAVPRAFARAVQAAIAQWTFEPLPAPQVHRVQLVLNPPER